LPVSWGLPAGGAASLFIGVRLVDEHVFGEALNRVRQDLNAANEMYVTRVKHVKTSLSITTLGFAFVSSVRTRTPPNWPCAWSAWPSWPNWTSPGWWPKTAA